MSENTVDKPWGVYMILLETPYTKVKKIVVNPNQKLSLQYHNHRSEVWTIVKGDGVFANGKQCVAQRVYPGLENSDRISLRAQGSEAELIAFDAWQMKSIYND